MQKIYLYLPFKKLQVKNSLKKWSYLFLGLLILFINLQCHFTNSEKSEKNTNPKIIIDSIKKYPINIRLTKWDSLIKHTKNNELSHGYYLFENANDLSIIDKNFEAIEQYNKALIIFKKYFLKEMTAKTLVNMGISYSYINKKSQAVQTLLKGLTLANELKDSTIISRVYGELAHIYYLDKNNAKAIEYLKKTGEMFQKLKDTEGISAIYNNIAILYQEQGKIKEAYDYTLKSLELITKDTDSVYIIETFNNLGALTFQYTKNKQKSLNYYKKALNLAKKYHYESINVYANLSDLYLSTGQQDSAIYFIKKAIAVPNHNYNEKIQLYDKLLRIILNKNHNKEALKILQIKDSLSELVKNQNTNENQLAIENNLELLNKQKQLAQAQQINNKNRIIFIFIIIVFLLGLLISYQLNRLDRLNLKQKQFILEQKVLRSQMNPHFIFNVLSSIQNSLIENKPIISATYLSKFAQLIRQNFDYIQKKHISLEEELKMIKNYLDTQKFRYKDKFDYSIIVDKSINTIETYIPPMILQPFVENAIEHGFNNIKYQGHLTIKISPDNDLICFEIIDNGSGFYPKNDGKEHALDIFKKRLQIMGKEIIDSFKITKLTQGTKVRFCLLKYDK